MTEKIRIGISSCLLGEKVRYDGGHKLDSFITGTLGNFFEFVPVCPEVECGMPTPRPTVRLVGDPQSPRLISPDTGTDHTDQMVLWGNKRLDELAREGLNGYIFKSKSPSSGMARIKVYTLEGHPSKRGIGIWAKMFMDRFPLLPVEDEGRLNDPGLRENFIERIFVYRRWRMVEGSKQWAKALVDFHTGHKLLIMAHSPEKLRILGRMTASISGKNQKDLLRNYLDTLSTALKLRSTIKKNVNVLQHIMGYFKKHLSSDEKQELIGVLEKYHGGYIPLIVPVTLLNHYVNKYNQSYLKKQYYLNPHPIELKLRNHV